MIDDEANMLKSLGAVLRRKGYGVFTAQRGQEGLKVMEREPLDLVVTDLRLPGMDGVSVLKAVKEKATHLPVILITAHGSMESAIEAVNLGAYSYVLKPIEMESFLVTVRRAVEHGKMWAENVHLRRELEEQYGLDAIVGESEPMREVFDMIQRVARTEHTVLIWGESGTGKELVAKAIHALSDRAGQRMVPVQCGALPETLMESELFGHEKGAFTGANEKKVGLFEIADKGTVFLDEIGDLSLETQAKLLRVLQEREIQPVGATQTRKVDIRILAATNRDLSLEMKEGRFREDLYYRLKVITIYLPKLQERLEDIPLLVQHFLAKTGHAAMEVSSEALDLLMQYEWPGNVRELENVVKRSVTLADGDLLQPEDLPPEVAGRPDGPSAEGEEGDPSFKDARSQWERDYFIRLLALHKGNVSAAARASGLSRRHLYDKLARYDIKA